MLFPYLFINAKGNSDSLCYNRNKIIKLNLSFTKYKTPRSFTIGNYILGFILPQKNNNLHEVQFRIWNIDYS